MYEIKNYQEGEDIFLENSRGEHAYIIKSGRVEIWKLVSKKRVRLTTLSAGEVFGEMALIDPAPRTASATALEKSDLIVVDGDKLEEVVGSSPPILKKLIKVLVDRLRKTDEKLVVDRTDDPLLSACHIINLSFQAQNGGREPLNYSDVVRMMKEITSVSTYDAQAAIDRLGALNLIEIRRGEGERKSIMISDPKSFILRAKRTLESLGGVLSPGDERSQSREVVDVDDLAAMAGVEPDLVIKKVRSGDIPKEMFFFYKRQITDWLKEQPENFFQRRSRQRIRPDEVTDVQDVVYIPDSTLRNVLATLDVYKLCLLMRGANEEVREKLRTNLPRNMVKVVEAEMGMMEEVIAADLERAENELVDLIRAQAKEEERKVAQ